MSRPRSCLPSTCTQPQHPQSIGRPRSRALHHPVGKKESDTVGLWINRLRLLHRLNRYPIRYLNTKSHFYIITSLKSAAPPPGSDHRYRQLYHRTYTPAVSLAQPTTKMPTPSTRSLRLKSSVRNNMNAACCLHPSHNNSRSLSPNPDEPARPSPLALDSIFALAALPTNHPHALKIGLPVADPEDTQDGDGLLSVPKSRRVRKSPSSAAFSSGLVQRVGKKLRRRATFGGSGDGSLLEQGSGLGSPLRDEAGFDGDAKRLSSGEVLGAVDADSIAAEPTASTSGFMRNAATGDGHPGGGDPPTLRLREL